MRRGALVTTNYCSMGNVEELTSGVHVVDRSLTRWEWAHFALITTSEFVFAFGVHPDRSAQMFAVWNILRRLVTYRILICHCRRATMQLHRGNAEQLAKDALKNMFTVAIILTILQARLWGVMYVQSDVDVWPSCEYWHDSEDGPIDRDGLKQPFTHAETIRQHTQHTNMCGYAKCAVAPVRQN